MELNFFSFLLNNEEAFIELNPNILETNLVNILILLGIVVYGAKTSFSKTLSDRQKEIIQTIENAQQDVVNASNYYYLAEKGYSQSFFWLQSWKALYEQDKINLVNIKYATVKKGLSETFDTTESLITNFEKKSFLALQRYMIYSVVSKIIRKFVSLPNAEQSKLIAITIQKLAVRVNVGGKNER
jgi:F0F1-type ATP synthase membrane subunit b/b'